MISIWYSTGYILCSNDDIKSLPSNTISNSLLVKLTDLSKSTVITTVNNYNNTNNSSRVV